MEVRKASGEWEEVAKVTPPAEKAASNVAELLAVIGRLAHELSALQPPPLFAGFFRPPEKTHLLGRGDPMDPREEVAPNALSALNANLGLRSEASDAVRRLAFAQWVTDPKKNPLTPRVLANRIWMHVFGHGIVDTPGDLGQAGGEPSHPELLDWLASEFVAGGWSLKSLVRVLVTSDAFRQSSAPNEAFAQIDSQTRYLWRFPPRRVEAEVLRDATLKIAGTLDLGMGGPGFRIHADKKRFEGWRVVDNAGPTTWRRMIYQDRMRGIDDAMQAEIFDQPTAALLTDMKQRGLLKDTLVVWCTEFGRMPFLQANGTGRDHNPDAFTCFLMGAGVKTGHSFGASDNFGFKAVQDKATLYDFNATILHLLGLNHEQLTYYHNGLERRLTDVHGHVIKQMLA